MDGQVIAALIAAGAAILVAGATAISSYISAKKNQKETKIMQNHNAEIVALNREMLTDKKIEEKRKGIYKALDEFYGPLNHYLATNRYLYDIFKEGKKGENGEEFRTLIALLNGTEFTGNDRVLLQKILEIGSNIQTLIRTKAGLIDDKELREELLPKADDHIDLIQKAFDKKLVKGTEQFETFVYPRNLDAKIKERIKALNEELEKLNSPQFTK